MPPRATYSQEVGPCIWCHMSSPLVSFLPPTITLPKAFLGIESIVGSTQVYCSQIAYPRSDHFPYIPPNIAYRVMYVYYLLAIIKFWKMLKNHAMTTVRYFKEIKLICLGKKVINTYRWCTWLDLQYHELVVCCFLFSGQWRTRYWRIIFKQSECNCNDISNQSSTIL